ncbi:MAG: hypothetical protein DMG59_09365 [Acidobacteria bacterium]|nr:MAG: hypothetical protein DMG59_09365 [Acidobacteriota bacterium]
MEKSITKVGNLLVMKFGGTSMGSAERIRVAARISAEHRAQRPVVTVVSAMSQVTDLLLDSAISPIWTATRNSFTRGISKPAANCSRQAGRRSLWPGSTG